MLLARQQWKWLHSESTRVFAWAAVCFVPSVPASHTCYCTSPASHPPGLHGLCFLSNSEQQLRQKFTWKTDWNSSSEKIDCWLKRQSSNSRNVISWQAQSRSDVNWVRCKCKMMWSCFDVSLWFLYQKMNALRLSVFYDSVTVKNTFEDIVL